MEHQPEIDIALKRRLKVAIALTAVIFLAEFIGGIVTNSLALISDSAHVFMDVVALSLSLFAIYISALPPSSKRTYGLHRAEVLTAFINGATIIFISLFIIYKAVARLYSPPEVDSIGMLVVAIVGLFVNMLVAAWLFRYAKKDLNIKSAFLHVVGDAGASVGVILGAVIIYYTGFNVADPIISILIAVIILTGAVRIVLEASHILLEGVPKDIDLDAVVDDIVAIGGVRGVHSIHIWSICHNINALSAHIDLEDLDRPKQRCILKEIDEKLAEKYHIFYTTLQVECSICSSDGLLRNLVHREHDDFY